MRSWQHLVDSLDLTVVDQGLRRGAPAEAFAGSVLCMAIQPTGTGIPTTILPQGVFDA
jgi:hypothetical protein